MPKVPFWIFIIIGVLYFSGTRIDTMDVDASQYAEISREMLKSGDYLHIYDRGLEYLDKPPFLFWVSAASMKVFGVNNFGFKFPSILFALWALFATYKLAKLLYGETTGRIAALVLACCQGMFLMANDIRCDTILMSWVITGIWLMQEWVMRRRLPYLLGAYAAIALGMMTKGPIALMVPVFCFGTDWVLKRQWRNFFVPAHLLGIVVMAVLLVPMSIGLYQQFDLHPEKLVNGKTGVSGLRFFYWSQSFGRITGESPWKNEVNIGFLFQNMLWSFLPWIVLFVPAFVLNIVAVVRQKFRLQPGQEWITTGGFLLTYLALGSSAYQLPHYIFVAYPLAAIFVAQFLYQLIEENRYPRALSFLTAFHAVIIAIILLVTAVLMVYVFPAHPLIIAAWGAGFILWLYLAFRKSFTGKLFWLPAVGMVIANIFLTNHVYTTLLQYQCGSQAGRYMHEHNIPAAAVAPFKLDDPINALHFYAGGIVTGIDTLSNIGDKKYLLTMEKGIAALQQKGVAYDVVKEGSLFKVSELTPGFLNPATRKFNVRSYYLVRLK